MATIYVDPSNGTDNADAGRGEGEGTSAYASVGYAVSNYGSFSTTSGNVIYLADTSADVLSAQIANIGTIAAPLLIEGYHYDGSNGGSAGTLTATGPFSTTIDPVGEIDGNDAVTQLFASLTYTTLKNLKLHSTTSNVLRGGAGTFAVNCEIYNGGGSYVQREMDLYACYVHNDTDLPINSFRSNVWFSEMKTCDVGLDLNEAIGGAFWSLIHDYNDAGIQFTSDRIQVVGCTCDGTGSNSDSRGIQHSGDSAAHQGNSILDTLITNHSGATAIGIHTPTGAACMWRENIHVYNNTTNLSGPSAAWESTVTETSDPYTDSASDDFSLVSGALSNAAATVSRDPANPDNVGALQDNSSGGAGETTSVFMA